MEDEQKEDINIIDNLSLLNQQIINKDKSINNKENEIINEEFKEENLEKEEMKETMKRRMIMNIRLMKKRRINYNKY